jgi:hypothetical protein
MRRREELERRQRERARARAFRGALRVSSFDRTLALGVAAFAAPDLPHHVPTAQQDHDRRKRRGLWSRAIGWLFGGDR